MFTLSASNVADRDPTSQIERVSVGACILYAVATNAGIFPSTAA